MSRSPIEMMVDKACGHDPSQPQTPTKTETELQQASELLLKVADVAKTWWVATRPEDWDEDRHLAQPAINCVHYGEAMLARAVANWVKIGG